MLFGHHTVDELMDLVRAKDSDMAELAKQRAGAPQVAQIDPSWDHDYATLKGRYDAAHKLVDNAIAAAHYNLTTPNGLIPAESEYQALLHAISPTPNTVTQDSLSGLSGRLAKIGVRGTPGYQTPQPQAWDALTASNQAVHAIQDTARAAVEGTAEAMKDSVRGGVWAAGKLANAPLQGAAEAFHVPIWVFLLLGGVGGGIGLYLLFRGVKAAAPAALRVAEVAAPGGTAIKALRAVNAGLGT